MGGTSNNGVTEEDWHDNRVPLLRRVIVRLLSMARQLIANDFVIFCHLRAKLRIIEVFIEAVRKNLEGKEL